MPPLRKRQTGTSLTRRRQGQVFLLLRNDLDLQVNPTEGVTLKSLLGTPDKPVVKPVRKPAAAPKTKLLIYKGTAAREYEWDK